MPRLGLSLHELLSFNSSVAALWQIVLHERVRGVSVNRKVSAWLGSAAGLWEARNSIL